MTRIVSHIIDGHLMRSPRPLHRLAIDFFWTSPSFRSSQYQQRPAWTIHNNFFASALLNRANLLHDCVQGGRHPLMHLCGIAALDEDRVIAVAVE